MSTNYEMSNAMREILSRKLITPEDVLHLSLSSTYKMLMFG